MKEYILNKIKTIKDIIKKNDKDIITKNDILYKKDKDIKYNKDEILDKINANKWIHKYMKYHYFLKNNYTEIMEGNMIIEINENKDYKIIDRDIFKNINVSAENKNSINVEDIYCKLLLSDTNTYSIDLFYKKSQFKFFYCYPHHISDVRDTIHFQSIIDGKYDIYEKFIDETSQLEHSKKKFNDLYKNFNINTMKKIEMKYNSSIDKYVIEDGVHRFSIIAYKKIFGNSIPIKYLNINMDNSKHQYLDTSLVPWECNRNQVPISKYKNVFWDGKHFIVSSETHIPNDLSSIIKRKKIDIPINTIIIKKSYIHFAHFFSNIGHYFIDNLIPISKMLLLNNDIKNRNVNIIFIKNILEKPEFQIFKSKNIQLLEPFTENVVKFISDYPSNIHFEEIIFYHNGYANKKKNWNIPYKVDYSLLREVNNIYNVFYSKNRNIIPQDITILSRKNAKYRRLVNEKELHKTLKSISSCNVNLVEFENLSIEEQNILMQQTKLFITPHGAGVISAFFMQPKTKCIIINPYGMGIGDFTSIYINYINAMGIDCQIFNNDIINEKSNTKMSYAEYRDMDIELNIKKFLKLII